MTAANFPARRCLYTLPVAVAPPSVIPASLRGRKRQVESGTTAATQTEDATQFRGHMLLCQKTAVALLYGGHMQIAVPRNGYCSTSFCNRWLYPQQWLPSGGHVSPADGRIDDE